MGQTHHWKNYEDKKAPWSSPAVGRTELGGRGAGEDKRSRWEVGQSNGTERKMCAAWWQGYEYTSLNEVGASGNKHSNLASIPMSQEVNGNPELSCLQKEDIVCGKPRCVATSQEKQADKIFFMNYSEREN